MEFNLEDPLANFKENQDCTISISQLFASEFDHMPSPNTLSSTDFNISFRCEAISLISQFSCNLDPYVVYLAINYLDRFMSKQEIRQGKPWLLRLIVMACLSLASKMKSAPFSLSEFQKEGWIIFEARSIQRMELVILGALEWRMRSITPFPFLNFYFTSIYELKDQSLKQALKDRASEIIFNAHNDIKFSEFKPSVIAASALIYASHDVLLPLQCSVLRDSVTSCEYLDKEMLSKCFNLMQGMVLRKEANESNMATSLVSTETPVSVLDRIIKVQRI